MRDVSSLGAIGKLELKSGDEDLIRVELAREQFERLAVKSGERSYIKPRRVRVFTER